MIPWAYSSQTTKTATSTCRAMIIGPFDVRFCGQTSLNRWISNDCGKRLIVAVASAPKCLMERGPPSVFRPDVYIVQVDRWSRSVDDLDQAQMRLF